MEIIEIFANRRSGHHFFMSWLVSNVSGERDTKIKDLNKITWINNDICHYNDATYHAFFDKQKVLNEIEDIINKRPKYLFINYEESDVRNELNKEGTLIHRNNPLKIVFIRDFLNTFASKWKVSETDLREFYFGFKNRKEIYQNINQWKVMAKNYLNDNFIGFKYEDLLINSVDRINFLKENFNVNETFKPNEFDGTKSSFSTLNFNERHKEVNFSNDFKEIINNDSELNYLIGRLNYEYKKLS
jgi:hypothetical protein